eukprot:CAMPEP_0181187388 /NCGR_PEP_ID=MMETSP1096-20121128/10545_1 /TAXON_ID=156174 ORGANISM="Chrysochromulina ericina, Strain CCMP281" /NCGR_SAMPLE_ID=MMETSP1096 /ASSEMBLY_ACC=CAM_ASM_000453 /LENGTH=150 /DNA_ID=CAMNT_0023276357 /DNA_START=412 /DNA_END=864 /DNA_ORIENTATION=-
MHGEQVARKEAPADGHRDDAGCQETQPEKRAVDNKRGATQAKGLHQIEQREIEASDLSHTGPGERLVEVPTHSPCCQHKDTEQVVCPKLRRLAIRKVQARLVQGDTEIDLHSERMRRRTREEPVLSISAARQCSHKVEDALQGRREESDA